MRNTAPRRINPAQGRNSYTYMRGSAAPALPQEEYTYRPGRAQQPRRKVKPAPVITDSFTRYHEKMNLSILYVLLGVAVFMVCAIALLSINAKMSAVRAEIKQTEALTQKTRVVNERLENMLSETVDMDEVKKTATTRLGMQAAAPHQIVTINVEKDSYSVQYEDQVAESKNKTFLEKIGVK